MLFFAGEARLGVCGCYDLGSVRESSAIRKRRSSRYPGRRRGVGGETPARLRDSDFRTTTFCHDLIGNYPEKSHMGLKSPEVSTC